MLSREDNELLCQVGPKTPMGEVFRRFWNPVLLASDLPPNEPKLVRLRILGESLVAFRDGSGRLGLIEEWCQHRRVSLALGRIENDGIRCLYHGWKFDADGCILETPNTKDERLKTRLRTPAYPLREAGGILWAYMGPPDKEPPFPRWRFMEFARENIYLVRLDSGSNYMQVVEGGADSSHVGCLHTNVARPGWAAGEFHANQDDSMPAALVSPDPAPDFLVEDTEFGFHYAALRPVAEVDGKPMHNVRITPIIMPSTRIIAARTMQTLLFEVPIDDHNTRTISVAFRNDGGPIDLKGYEEGRGRDNAQLVDHKTWRYLGSWENNFGQDRSTLDTNWTGMRGLVMEDLAMSMSPGPIVDRAGEHLVAADVAIVRARQQLLESARRVQKGADPFGVSADLYGVKGYEETVSPDVPWQALVPGHRPRAGE